MLRLLPCTTNQVTDLRLVTILRLRLNSSYSGQKWKVINFFDVNSMYVSTFAKEMPTGLGLEWNPRPSGKFYSSLMGPHNCSLSCVQWIDFMNNDPRFVDRSGKRQYIQHAWNRAEVRIGRYPVDGFVQVDEQPYILQYDGCFWVRS